MPSKRPGTWPALLLLAVVVGLCQSLMAAELSTLFTTPQERQIINSNRYKGDKPKAVEQVEPHDRLAPRDAGHMIFRERVESWLAQEEVLQQYVISGITISRDGLHSVWINSVMYEDGEQLEDGSRLKVQAGDEVRVRITAPDGKQYYATSGQTIEVTYLVNIEN